MKKILTIALALCLAASSSYAITWTYHDFGTNVFDHNNNWAPINYPSGVGHQPSPGYFGEGGEKFDIEGWGVAMDNQYAYLYLTSSFGMSAHSAMTKLDYNMGDLFLGVDGDKYAFAIDVSTGGFYKVNNSWNYIPTIAGGYYANSTVRNAIGAYDINFGAGSAASHLGGVDEKFTMYAGLETNPLSSQWGAGSGDTWIKEFRFDRSLLGSFSKLSVHNTLACGNDLLDETWTNPVPEPTTLMLFGVGMIGAGLIRRRGIA